MQAPIIGMGILSRVWGTGGHSQQNNSGCLWGLLRSTAPFKDHGIILWMGWVGVSGASPLDLWWCALACPAAALSSVVAWKAKDFHCKLPVLPDLYQSCFEKGPGSLSALVCLIPGRPIMPTCGPMPCGQDCQRPFDNFKEVVPGF